MVSLKPSTQFEKTYKSLPETVKSMVKSTLTKLANTPNAEVLRTRNCEEWCESRVLGDCHYKILWLYDKTKKTIALIDISHELALEEVFKRLDNM